MRVASSRSLVLCIGSTGCRRTPFHAHPQPRQNAYKATIESAQRKNLNTIPEIQIRIFPGKDEVCVRVRDYVS